MRLPFHSLGLRWFTWIAFSIKMVCGGLQGFAQFRRTREKTFVSNKMFWKNLIEGCSSHLYASFGTFCVQIGQLFVAQWVFKQSEEFRNRRHFPSMRAICRFSNILQRLTVPRIIDQFGRKRCQKKRKDVNYELL